MAQTRSRGRPLTHRDTVGQTSTARSWESLTERLIREGREAGAFDDLPNQGRPFDLQDETHSGEMAVAHHILRNARVAPAWIEADKRARRLRAEIDTILAGATTLSDMRRERHRERLSHLLAEHTATIRNLDTIAPTPRQQRPALDHAAILAAFDATGRAAS